jgi:hypothetical protein
VAAAVATVPVPALADLAEFYVAVDGRPTLTSGTYNGLPNPNHNRLTFRYAHVYGPGDPNPVTSSHFHSIGAYSYTGPAANPVVVSTNTNNRIPETSSGQPPLPLVADPLFPSKLVSKPGTAAHFSDFEFRSTNSLNPASSDPGEVALYTSSNPAFTGPLAGAQLALKLVSKTPGLHVADETGTDVLTNAGDTHSLIGAGETAGDFKFSPTFWVDANAPAAAYSATFTLVDTRAAGGFGESGTFSIDVQTPEPGALAGVGVASLLATARRRRRR